MAKAKFLSAYEKGQIDAYRKKGMSLRDIGTRIKRSKDAVHHYVTKGQKYGDMSKAGRKKILAPRDVRRIHAKLSNGAIGIPKIKHDLNLTASVPTIWRAINNSKRLVYKKKLTKYPLSKKNKMDRLAFAKKNMSMGEKWNYAVFSDEKKFNLDGPDGWNYYGHDLRKDEQLFSKRYAGGGSVMCWAAFNSFGKSNLYFVEGNLNHEQYIHILETTLLPFKSKFCKNNWIFQHDNATPHKHSKTKEWFLRKNIEVLDWPPYSPDLNPIENLWGILARKVYANGRQFSNQKELVKAIQDCWNEISLNELKSLTENMSDRIFDLINCNGSYTKY